MNDLLYKEPIHVSTKLTMLPMSPSAPAKTFGEEEKGKVIAS